MPVNLITLVSQFLTPNLVATIARALGLDPAVASKALAVAVPGLLGSLAGVASTQDGSRKIFNAVTSQRPAMVEGLNNALDGPGKDNVIQSGDNLLSSLLGGSAVSALAGAVGKYAGMGTGAGGSLLGLLAPVVMGVLGKQKSEAGLDAFGLSDLLTSQKDNIAAALPAGMVSTLRAAGMPGFSGNMPGDAPSARETQYMPPPTGDTRSGLPKWANWLIPLIVIAAIGAWLLERNTEMGERSAKVTNQAVDTLPVGSVDVGSSLQTTLDGLKTTLRNVTDTSTAQAAMPKLQEATAQLDKLDGLRAQLPTSRKTALAAIVTSARPSIDELMDRMLAIPGVAAIAKPATDEFRSKLDALTKA